jgi:acetolactate synthase II small subunit
MTNTLRIEILESEGALTRLIGLVERRGFHIARMNKTSPHEGHSTVTLDVVARERLRPTDVLTRQIARLLDVRTVMPAVPNPEPTNRGRSGCPPQH